MDIVLEAKRNFRRYRLYNKAAHPVRFWFLDSAILLARILLLLLFLGIIYTLLRTTSLGPLDNWFERTAESSHQTQPATAPVAEPVIIGAKSTQLTAAAQRSTVAAVPQRQGSASGPEILGPAWLLQQSVGDYTIQFASASDVAKLVAFSNRFTDGDAVTIYPFQQREGQTVYGLAKGIYADFASARKAILAMPDALQAQQPWIRAIDELQTEISAFRAQ